MWNSFNFANGTPYGHRMLCEHSFIELGLSHNTSPSNLQKPSPPLNFELGCNLVACAFTILSSTSLWAFSFIMHTKLLFFNYSKSLSHVLCTPLLPMT